MSSCDVHQCCCHSGDKKCAWGMIYGVLKIIAKIAKIAVFTGLTLVLFDIHHGIKAEFQNMPQQMMPSSSVSAEAGS